MSARSVLPLHIVHPRTLAASLLVAACAAFGCSAPPGDVNSPREPDALDEGAGGAPDDGDDGDDGEGGAGTETSTGAAAPTRCGDLTACAGTCVDLETDAQNCGACGDPCALGESCEDGACGS